MTQGLPTPPELDARGAQMFPAFTDAQLARVTAFGTEKEFADGAIVFDQGDYGVPFYVVLDGELEVVHPNRKREELVTRHVAKHFTGELSSLSDRRSLVRGRAKGRLRVLCIAPPRMRALIQTDSEVSELIMRAFILRRVGLLSHGYGDVIVIGSRNSAATLKIQEFLTRNGHPYRYVDVDRDPDLQLVLDEFKIDVKDIPILICRDDLVLRNPSEVEIADCLGFNAKLELGVVHDVVICGAGPGGLAAAVYGASEGLDSLVLESVAPGGQAGASSKIENYLGFPTGVSGQALAARAFNQA
jgi:thioredoxin reductase (NADPH)